MFQYKPANRRITVYTRRVRRNAANIVTFEKVMILHGIKDWEWPVV
jgi:hypothetical protein